jgi:thioredoxin-like negative regulator of GroEL
MNKSLEHLTRAVQLAPEVSTNHLYLAETLIRLGQYDQARQELDATLQAPRHAIQPGGLAEDRQKARQLREELEGK